MSDRTACHIPRPVKKIEADLYLKIRNAHCAKKEARDHPCAGVVTLAPGHMTLQCPLCGDYRGIIRHEGDNDAEAILPKGNSAGDDHLPD